MSNSMGWILLAFALYLLLMVVIGAVCATPGIKKLLDKYSDNKIVSAIETIVYIGLLIICTAALISSSFNPFIYFRF